MLKILPIYRIRDGYGELNRNQEVFEDTVGVLKSNVPICILPEGNHEGLKRLRPLKKGIFRIAFQAEESTQFKLNLHIVPVGLDYSNYFNAGSDLIIVYGTPIKIADFAEQYRENEQRTINMLMNVLAENMRSVMIHIPEENYKLTYQISEIYEPNVWNTCNNNRHPYNKLTVRQYIVSKITEAFTKFPEKVPEIEDALRNYKGLLDKFGLSDSFLAQKPLYLLCTIELLLSVLLLPLHIYGMFLNYLPYKIPVWVASKIKDPHFKSSIQFGISLFLLPIYYILLISVFCMFSGTIAIKLIFGLSLPITGLFAFYNYKHMLNLWSRLKIVKLKITKPELYIALTENRNQIINLIKTTINS